MVSWQASPFLLPRAPLAFLSLLKLPFPKLPFPSLSNACHAGYFFKFDRNFANYCHLFTWWCHEDRHGNLIDTSNVRLVKVLYHGQVSRKSYRGVPGTVHVPRKWLSPASANEANSFMFCGMCLFRSSQYIYFFHNFRGLKWIAL